ncbi:thiamine phosphate synthase, partial [bacterium]|nr:thiamine phosphate synthase [bacterium]
PVVETVKLFEELRKGSPFMLQLRLKGLPLNAVKDQLKELSTNKPDGTLLILNDYDRAVLDFPFDGIHLGQEDLLVADVELIKSNKLILGISTHGLYELAVAKFMKPSYVALGPVFDTICKSMKFGPQGIDQLSVWKKVLVDIPLIAIGGLNIDRSNEALKRGADVVAVQSDVTLKERPLDQLNKYHSELV